LAIASRSLSHPISRRSFALGVSPWEKTRYRFAIKNNLELSRRHLEAMKQAKEK
jgi:hypothetical protein